MIPSPPGRGGLAASVRGERIGRDAVRPPGAADGAAVAPLVPAASEALAPCDAGAAGAVEALSVLPALAVVCASEADGVVGETAASPPQADMPRASKSEQEGTERRHGG